MGVLNMKALQNNYCLLCDGYTTCTGICAVVKKDLKKIYYSCKEIPLSSLCIDDRQYNYFVDSAKNCWGSDKGCIDYEVYEWVETYCELTTRQLEIFFLAAVEGLSYQKIADRLGITRQSVNKSLQISKNKILQALYIWNMEV